MRLFLPQNGTLAEQTTHSITLEGAQGEMFRVQILDHDLVRVTHYPDGTPRLDRTWSVVGADGDMPREGRPREDVSRWPCPAIDITTAEKQATLTTDHLTLTLDFATFALTVAQRDGATFHADSGRFAYSYNGSGRDVYHYSQRQAGEHYYGFGERSGELSKVGRRLRMVNHDAIGYDAATTDPLYKHIAFYITFNPQLNVAYGLFYDNLSTCTFDMGQEIDAYRGHYRYYQADDGDIDYYLIYGSTIADVVQKYATLTGKPALMPRWSLGYLGSTMKYTEADNAQEQLKQFVELCREHDIPCDLFHLSSGYTTNANGERCVFTWNRDRVPDPQAMVDNFHAGGMKLAPNVKPYLLQHHPLYADVAQRGGFIKAYDTDEPQISTFWSGGLNEMGEGAYVDFTSAAGYDWWQEQIQVQLLDYGIDAIWNDNNEFEIWDDAARCDGYGQALSIGLARPLQALLMAHASYHALLKHKPDERPFVLSRSGGAGIQRYAQVWSGDNNTSWHDLRYNVSMGLGASLSGLINTGNDVGGFAGDKPSPELLVRWVQNHVFYPRFCIHSWNSDRSVTEPWMYPEVLPHIRQAIELRYRLIPYLYTLLFNAAHTGQPIIRPLVYHFPNDERCHTESFSYLLGDSMLVATILHEGAQSHDVYLPAGAMWCDWHTGDWYTGGQTITVPATLDNIPLFIREGGIIPMGKVMPHVGATADDLRELRIFPPPVRGDEPRQNQFTLIEDDGQTFAYQSGGYRAIKIILKATQNDVMIAVETSQSDYTPDYAALTVILPQGETRPVSAGVGTVLQPTEDPLRYTIPLTWG